MTLDRAYVLIVDTDADHIAAAVRSCGDALSVPTFVARSGDDAVRILQQLGPPALLMTALALPCRDGLSVIESLRRIDDNAAVIAWTADRELREYVSNRLAHTRAKVLGRSLSPALCRRCIDALVGCNKVSKAPDPPEDREERWLDLAETARRRLRVAGAAAYTRVRGGTEYRWSVSWRPDAAMPNFPAALPSAIEEVIASGVGRMWTDLTGDALTYSSGMTSPLSLRSLAIVPIVRDREIAGALCVFDSESHALRDDDLETLSAIAARTTDRRAGPTLPVERAVGDAIIKKELARVSRDQLPLSIILFAVTARRANEMPAIDDIFVGAVRGNDVVVRWTSAEVLVVLVGVDRSGAERVAERIRGAVEMRAANEIAVAGTVTERLTTESFEDTVARAANLRSA
jgi:CheY-like chemotaxis protein